MKKLLLLCALLLCGSAQAQSNPHLVFGQVPTAAQWNSYFSAKQDVLSAASPNTVFGNDTGGALAPTFLSVPSCSGANQALTWVTNAGFSCATIAGTGGITINATPISGGVNGDILSVNGSTVGQLSLASPPAIGGTTPSSISASSLSAGFVQQNGSVNQWSALGNANTGGVAPPGVLGAGFGFGANHSSGNAEANLVYASASGHWMEFDSWNGTTFTPRAKLDAVGQFALLTSGLISAGPLSSTIPSAVSLQYSGGGFLFNYGPTTSAYSALQIATCHSDQSGCQTLINSDASDNVSVGNAVGSTTINGSSSVTNKIGSTQGTQLTSSSFTVGDGTHTSFQALSPGANNWTNFVQAFGNTAGNTPFLLGTGSTNANLGLSSSGSGAVFLTTEGGTKVQFAAFDNASGADYVTVTSGSSAASLSTNLGNLNLLSTGGSVIIASGINFGVTQGMTVGGLANVPVGHEEFHGTAPGVVAGTGATIVGNDSVGRVTVGTTPAATVVLTFASSWTNAPVCFAQDETGAVTMRTTAASVSAVTFTSSLTLTAAAAVSYRCQGYN